MWKSVDSKKIEYSPYRKGVVNIKRIIEQDIVEMKSFTGFGLLELNRQVPRPVRHALANVFGLVAGMRGVTGTTGSASLFLVHVDVMEIAVAVAEVGQLARPLGQREILRVTGEAQGIVVHAERRIEPARVILDQKPEVLASVGLVTAFAVLVSDGSVEELLVLDLGGERGDGLAVFGLDRLVMTGGAQGHRRRL